MYGYKFIETNKIKECIIEIKALKIVFDNLKVLPHVEQTLRRESLLKSSVYSARVEGNPLIPEDLDSGEQIHKIEISNLLSAYNYIYSRSSPKNLSIKLIKDLHKIVLKNISENAGSFRNEPWGIFNSSGVAIHLAPLHIKLPKLMSDYVLSEKSMNLDVLIKSAILQFQFEKIHPFADGNGRVGRLISTFIMNRGGYGFNGLIPIEEIMDNNRNMYYAALEPSNDVTNFVEFYLESFIKSAKDILTKTSNLKLDQPEDLLPPRRKEIYNIIKNHPYSSFDLISRRFSKVNPKTLHYDLKQMINKNLLHKIGTTRGVTYIVNNSGSSKRENIV
jgi:Fic family protein